jgi:hypothetical protein
MLANTVLELAQTDQGLSDLAAQYYFGTHATPARDGNLTPLSSIWRKRHD